MSLAAFRHGIEHPRLIVGEIEDNYDERRRYRLPSLSRHTGRFARLASIEDQ